MFFYVRNRFNENPSYCLTRGVASSPHVRYVEYLGAPLYILPQNKADFKSSKKGKYWYNIGRAEAKFTEDFGPLCFQLLERRNDITPWLKPIRELFRQRWVSTYISSDWTSDLGFQRYADALLALSDTGQASIALLTQGERLLAFSYNLQQEGTFYFYQHCADQRPEISKYSIGKIFLVHLLTQIIEGGRYRLFDFMAGESPYKLEWATCVQKVYFRLERKHFSNTLGFYAFYFAQIVRIGIMKNTTVKNLLRPCFGLCQRLVQSARAKPEGTLD